jgi:hypothetical protein
VSVCLQTESLGKSHYMLTFTDDYSRKTFVYFLKSKDEVFDKFVEFKANVETQTGEHVLIIYSVIREMPIFQKDPRNI